MISVVVPVYRSEASLEELVRRLKATLDGQTKPWELILINDASPDGSWRVIERLVKEDASIRAMDLMRNYGQHNALLCGIRAARGDIVVTLDDDLQNPPEEIPKLLAKLAEGCDVIYGAPAKNSQAIWRRAGSWLTRRMLSGTMGEGTSGHVSSFRALRTDLRDAFSAFQGPNVNLDVLLTWGACRFSYIEVDHHPRAHGSSAYTLRSLARHASNMITGFTVLPLQLASIVGFSFTLVGFCLLLYVVGVYFTQGRVVPGFYSLAALLILFGGAQLFALGIIGEYLARMHFHAMRRNTYAVRREIGCADKK